MILLLFCLLWGLEVALDLWSIKYDSNGSHVFEKRAFYKRSVY